MRTNTVKIQPSLHLLRALPLWLLLTGCENKEAPDQLTVVEGRVLRHSDKVPFARVPVLIEPYSTGFAGAFFSAPIASTQTDATGRYTLSFSNQKSLYYAVSCDPQYADKRLDFLPWPPIGPVVATVGNNPRICRVTIGQKNTVDFYPDQNMVILLHLQLRSTRFQQLLIGGAGWKLKASLLDTVIVRRGHWVTALSESAVLRRVGSSGQTLQDSTIYLYSLGNIATDTIRTTFRFVQ